MTHRFWPIGESAQADYETLREAVLQGQPLQSLSAARFVRRGLAGLIAWPGAEPIYVATVQGARRAPWTPHTDPRLDALAAGYELILSFPGEHRQTTTCLSMKLSKAAETQRMSHRGFQSLCHIRVRTVQLPPTSL